MVKLVSLLNRPPGVSRQDFQKWWKEDHAALAARLPGLSRYVISFPIEENAPFDGMAELYFSNVEDLRSSLDSAAGRASVSDTLAHVGGRVAMVMIENDVPIGAGGC